MTRRGQSGGLICLNSFLLEEDRQNVRTASTHVHKVAMKEGCQTLYADPEETLKKYKDFDIAKAMSDRKDSKLLWVRARAIDADVVNANGDYFSKEELLKEIEVNGEKKPAYKTFEGCPIYTNHKNDDIEEAKGMVVFAEWDDDENCVWCTFFIDEEAYPHIARGIRQGYMHDVSMGCQVDSGTCSICGNKAFTEKEYCEHMSKYKGKNYPSTGKKAYEINHGLKFIELSVVGDGAFESCSIDEIYDVDEILEKALNFKKRASAIHSDILVATTFAPKDINERQVYEDCLRQVAATSRDLVRLAQSPGAVAGTLVGGQVMAQEGGGQNTTVSSILNFLGIDSAAGLNILDMLNLALNFLEVTVMNLFARKDNVDLAHVGKITKSMADLQATMQDMLDDGVESGGGAGQQQPNVPLNQGQLGQQGPAAPPVPAPGTAPSDYGAAGDAGRMMGPQTQNQAFMGAPMGIGGGVMASNNRERIILWDTPEEDEDKREIFASTLRTTNNKDKSVIRLSENLSDFAKALGIAPSIPYTTNIEEKISASKKQISGGKNMDIFDQQFNANYRKREGAFHKSFEFHVDDLAKENRITLCSNGTVKAFHKGVRMAWEPDLTDEQIEKIAHGNKEVVAADLLTEFKKALRTASTNGRLVAAWKDPETNAGEVMEHQTEEVRTGTDDDVKENLLDEKDAKEYGRKGEDNRTREETLEAVRKGTPELGKVKEKMLADDAGLYGWSFSNSDVDVKEALIEDARTTVPTEVIEEQLNIVRDESGSSNDLKIVDASVNAAINALAQAVVTSGAHPKEIIAGVKSLTERSDFAQLITIAALGNKRRETLASRAEFHGTTKPLAINAAILDAAGKRVSEEIPALDLADAITVLADDERIFEAVTSLAKTKLANSQATSGTVKVSKQDKIRAALGTKLNKTSEVSTAHVKAAISAYADSALDQEIHPKEVIAAIANADEDALIMEVEMARTASAVQSRITMRERKNFYGNQRTASKEDAYENIVGWLADYADAYKIDSGSLVKAVKLTAATPVVATGLAVKLIKTASIEVTDEKSTTKRFHCRTEDLGGIDVKADDFDQQLTQKVGEILAQSGYTIDPNTFTLSEVTVSPDGDVTASVTSRISKSFKADDVSPVSAMAPDINIPENSDANVQSSFPNQENEASVEGTIPLEVQSTEPGIVEDSGSIMTAAYKANRIAKRQQILEKFAQMPGAGGAAGGAAGAGAPMGGVAPSPLDGALGAGADDGISSFSGGAEEEIPGTEGDGGVKQPWGTVCPQCGSKNVDVANGEGNCQDCNAQLEYQFTVAVKPGSDEKTEGGPEAAPETPGLGDDMGLGGATAPAPTTPPAAGGAPGAPPAGPGVMASATWSADSDMFVRLAQSDFNRNKEKALPVGFVCPGCGNRDAVTNKRMTFCHKCGTIATKKVTADTNDPTKVKCTIVWM